MAVENHFEDSSIKGALEDIDSEQVLNKAEYHEAPKTIIYEDQSDILGGDERQHDLEIH